MRLRISRVIFLINQQKPTFCYKNPQKNHMNAYTTARFHTFRAKQIFDSSQLTVKIEKFIFCKPPYLLKKNFKKTTKTYTLLQKSSKKSYERIHHSSISYVSCKPDFWKLGIDSEQSTIHCYRGVSCSWRNFYKKQQKPTLCYKNPQKNHMNAYTTARFHTFRANQIFEN